MAWNILLRVLGILLLVALNAYFVATEFCAVTARRGRLETFARQRPLFRLALKVKNNLVLYLSATQLGVTMASLGLGALMEPAIGTLLTPLLRWMHLTPEHQLVAAYVVSFAIGMSLHIVIGEQLPKNWAIRTSDRLFPALVLPLILFTFCFYPIIYLLSEATNGVLRLAGVQSDSKGNPALPHTAHELRSIVEQAIQQGVWAKGHERLVSRAINFGDLKARQIMTPRAEVDILLLDQPLGEVLKTVQKSAYTRFPLCQKDIDHVVGLVHTKDLLTHLKLMPGRLRLIDPKDPGGEAIVIPDHGPGSAVHVIGSGDLDLRKIRRNVIHVPEFLPAPRLLRLFQTTHSHLAVVVDEYGMTLGIVTMEDVLEELVGEIEDEFDTAAAQKPFTVEGDSYRVSGLYPMHELKERLQITDLEIGNVDTLSGFIVQKLARWPRVGDTLRVEHYQVKVVAVDQNRRVGQVVITKTAQERE